MATPVLTRHALRKSTLPKSVQCLSLNQTRQLASDSKIFKIQPQVREALETKSKPVVALETTIYTHGFPYPENVALASELESIVRVNGGVPATIGILEGVARVGLDPEEIIRLVSTAGSKDTLKISRRDIGYACGLGLAGKRLNGGTTIAGTMVLAHLAGIKVFATGGLGGVHRGAESSMDISADLTELGRTPVAVISSGCKSFLDIPRTLEYLETEGALVGTFADGRDGSVEFPAFWSRDSGVKSPVTIQNEVEAAAIIHAQSILGLTSGIHFANPIPAEFSISKAEMDVIIAQAIEEANAAGASGKDNTPFILSKIKELSGSKSIKANRALIAANVKRGTLVAKELLALELAAQQESGTQSTDYTINVAFEPPASSKSTNTPIAAIPKPDIASTESIVVAGALAIDYSCDYIPSTTSSNIPQLHTSNPASITQTLGGVAHNIARAAHLLTTTHSPSLRVHLLSAVGPDLAGRAAVAQLAASGMEVAGIQTLTNTISSSTIAIPDANKQGQQQELHTSQYMAINDSKKDLHLAMADMSILESANSTSSFSKTWLPSILSLPSPRAMVIDANWPAPTLHEWLHAARKLPNRPLVAFEPVSVAKAARLFPPLNRSAITGHGRWEQPPPSKEIGLPVYPLNILDLITPNQHELRALHSAARANGYFELPFWWTVVNAFGLGLNAKGRFSAQVPGDLIEEGVPQMAVQLLPFVGAVVVTLGKRGCLVVRILDGGEERDERVGSYLVSGGGLYMRFFPAAEAVGEEDVVSVNGIGDTFLGALVAGMTSGSGMGKGERKRRNVEDVIDFAQRAAVRSLKSKEAVSPELVEMGREM
ncbi:hypothetical protein K402DRAFT_414399 [Aulographum hederae CBS 113979]|uniref:Carbohydrate kinase PfkB domain-containing protein n=1 Tax=Aulographum hederae CBS 113979 TaxID=1176131 RepID=A0A6G1GRM0_9PEZI|nr:hypothetical protein K402DRAFT_414399 [Aulographum hederae CBS 113979]